MKVCTISGCNNKHFALRFCKKHYIRYKAHGSPHITKTERHGFYRTPIYKSWQGMAQRCNNSKEPAYKYYGGRGISVCKRWQTSFSAFYEDMGDKPPGMEIDRIDNDGNYEPDNCRWTTRAENARNKRNTVLSYELADKIRNLYKKGMFPKEISKKLNIKTHNIGGVLYKGYWMEKAGKTSL